MDISIVIPCYNESEVFAQLLHRVLAVAESQNQNCEIIFVDDGSTDDTWSQIESSAKATSSTSVVGIKLSRNHGHQKALTAGLARAQGRHVLMMDADLQDPPELLPDMLALMNQGYDIVYGRRLSRSGESWFKKLSARVYYRILRRLSDVDIPVDTGDFRLINRKVLDKFLQMPEQDRYIRGMFAWLGHRQIGLEYERAARTVGTTKYPLRAMIRLATDGLASFSTVPLRLATSLAALSLLIATLLGIYVLVSWIFYSAVPGWASVLLATSFFAGVQLLTLGIMGEYIGRIYIEVKKRPLYLVEKDTDIDEP